jgi:hypothetical protein
VIVVPLLVILRRRRQGKLGEAVTLQGPQIVPNAGESTEPTEDPTADEPPEPDGEEPASESDHKPVLVPATPRRIVVVRVVGPVEVTGFASRPGRALVIDIVVVLAIEAPRVIASEELRLIFAEQDKDLTTRAIWNRVSDLRRALGPEMIERDGPGYRLTGELDCDWTRFKDLVKRDIGATRDDRLASLSSALDLVSGVPFTRASPVLMRWAGENDLPGTMQVAVVEAANELSAGFLEDSERIAAEEAAYAGLKADPYSYVLCEALLKATAHSRLRFDRAWQLIVTREVADDRLRMLREELRRTVGA